MQVLGQRAASGALPLFLAKTLKRLDLKSFLHENRRTAEKLDSGKSQKMGSASEKAERFLLQSTLRSG
jgi:hypothetical protein